MNGEERCFPATEQAILSKGVMILINPSLDLKVEKCISDQKGRFIILKLLRDNTPLVLVNV